MTLNLLKGASVSPWLDGYVAGSRPSGPAQGGDAREGARLAPPAAGQALRAIERSHARPDAARVYVATLLDDVLESARERQDTLRCLVGRLAHTT